MVNKNAKISVAGLKDDQQLTLDHLLEKLDSKTYRNRLRSRYYDMKHMVSLVGSVIPAQYARVGIVLGWSGKAVDILSRRCNLDAFEWPDGELEDLGYQQVWEGNNLGSEVGQGTISSLIHSTSFVINTRGGRGETLGLIHFRDALGATGDWNTRTRHLDNLLSVTARDDHHNPTALTLYLDGLTISAEKGSKEWEVTDKQEHPWGVPAEPLPYKPRLGRPFGSSRISRAVMSLQDQATRTVVRLEAHSDIYAIPDLWMLGADMSLFRNDDGSVKTTAQVMMGRIKGVPDDLDVEDPALARADVKQFAASSPEPHIMALKQQAQLFSGETAIPLSSLGVSDMTNPTSADSYIASREDLIAEAEGATDDWAPGLKRAMLRALAMQNGLSSIPEEWETVTPKWRSPLYLSRASQADAGVKQISAIPWLADSDVGLELVGLTDQQIKRANGDRRRQSGSRAIDIIAARELSKEPEEAPEEETNDGGS